MKPISLVQSIADCKSIALSETRIHKVRDFGGWYFRSYGLEYGNLIELIERDTLFVESINQVRSHTMLVDTKLVNLYLLISNWLPLLGNGDIIEFGSFLGGSSIFMALIASKLGLPINVYGLDTFQGMPVTSEDIDFHSKGDFANTSLESAQILAEKLNLENITFVAGLFEDTARNTLSNCNPILLAHIDCDIESAVVFSYNTVKNFMNKKGGYIVFDDPLHSSCLGAFQAVEDCLVRQDCLNAEQVYPHLVYRYPKIEN